MSEETIKELRKLAYECQTLMSRYTRAPGVNGDRVADLLSGDTYDIGTKMRWLLEELEEPQANECQDQLIEQAAQVLEGRILPGNRTLTRSQADEVAATLADAGMLRVSQDRIEAMLDMDPNDTDTRIVAECHIRIERARAERDRALILLRELTDEWNRASDREREIADRWGGYHAGARTSRQKCEGELRDIIAILEEPEAERTWVHYCGHAAPEECVGYITRLEIQGACPHCGRNDHD